MKASFLSTLTLCQIRKDSISTLAGVQQHCIHLNIHLPRPFAAAQEPWGDGLDRQPTLPGFEFITQHACTREEAPTRRESLLPIATPSGSKKTAHNHVPNNAWRCNLQVSTQGTVETALSTSGAAGETIAVSERCAKQWSSVTACEICEEARGDQRLRQKTHNICEAGQVTGVIPPTHTSAKGATKKRKEKKKKKPRAAHFPYSHRCGGECTHGPEELDLVLSFSTFSHGCKGACSDSGSLRWLLSPVDISIYS